MKVKDLKRAIEALPDEADVYRKTYTDGSDPVADRVIVEFCGSECKATIA